MVGYHIIGTDKEAVTSFQFQSAGGQVHQPDGGQVFIFQYSIVNLKYSIPAPPALSGSYFSLQV
jgi:hypothetical protein